jgi:putative chitinase
MITRDMIKTIAPSSKDEIVTPLVVYLNKHMNNYEVNTYLRVCHFLAQAAHESASFKTLEEYASGVAYEGRKDLGNTVRGDGKRYKGRGIFQLTGRFNYRDMGKKLNLDLEGNPDLAKSPEVSVLTALEYWKSRGLSSFADKDDVATITKRINGGFNGFEDRKNYLAKAKRVIPKTFSFMPAAVNPLVPPIVVARLGDKSPYIADLQNMLIKKGAKITADGDFGPKTEQSVKDFQKSNGLAVSGLIDTDTLNKMMV